MSDNEKKLDLIYGELLNRCWKDEKLLERFRNETAKVLSEAGIPVTAGANYHLMEQSQDKYYLILPQNCPAEEMEKLDTVKADVKVKAGLHDDAVIEVLQNTDTDVYLPYYPAPKFKPLTDEESEAAAGGIYKEPDDPKALSMESAWTYEQDIAVTHSMIASEIIAFSCLLSIG